MRRMLLAGVATMLACAPLAGPASAGNGTNQADLFAGNKLQGEGYWTPDRPICDPDYDNEPTTVSSGGTAAFLPHSGCGLNYTSVYVHDFGGCFQWFRARLGGSGELMTALVRVFVDDDIVAAGEFSGVGGEWVSEVFSQFSDLVPSKSSKIRVDYVVTDGPSWANMEFDYATFIKPEYCNNTSTNLLVNPLCTFSGTLCPTRSRDSS